MNLSSPRTGKGLDLSVCVGVGVGVQFTSTVALSSIDMQQPDVEMAVGCSGERLLSPKSGCSGRGSV